MKKDPTIVIDSIINQEGNKTETNAIRVYPISITRYAWLEKIDSPFLDTNVQFGVSTVIPTAFVFCSTNEDLRKYNSGDKEKLISDAFKWADENLTLEDTPEIIKNITDQMMKLNRAAPNGSDSEPNESVDGSKKK